MPLDTANLLKDRNQNGIYTTDEQSTMECNKDDCMAFKEGTRPIKQRQRDLYIATYIADRRSDVFLRNNKEMREGKKRKVQKGSASVLANNMNFAHRKDYQEDLYEEKHHGEDPGRFCLISGILHSTRIQDCRQRKPPIDEKPSVGFEGVFSSSQTTVSTLRDGNEDRKFPTFDLTIDLRPLFNASLSRKLGPYAQYIVIYFFDRCLMSVFKGRCVSGPTPSKGIPSRLSLCKENKKAREERRASAHVEHPLSLLFSFACCPEKERAFSARRSRELYGQITMFCQPKTSF